MTQISLQNIVVPDYNTTKRRKIMKESKLKNITKKSIVIVMTLAMVLSILAIPQTRLNAQAADKKVYINPLSATSAVYVPGHSYSSSSIISIVGCNKASQIKNLKSSNKNIKVYAKKGYISVKYAPKAGKSTITCTVKGVKLKTTFTVRKYTNPISKITYNGKNYTSNFNNDNVLNKSYAKTKNKLLTVKAKPGWKITYVAVHNSKSKLVFPNKSSYSAKVSLTSKTDIIMVGFKQTKTGLTEYVSIHNNKL